MSRTSPVLGSTPFVRALVSCVAAFILWTATVTEARAQAGDLPGFAPMGGGAPSGPPSGAPPSGSPPAGDMPETHAAGGMETTLPQGDEPSLPEEPLLISEKTRARIGADGDPESLGTGEDATREFYGLYYNEKAGEYRYRVAFPVWAERKQPSSHQPEKTDRASLYGGLYYNRRSPGHTDDILFPLAWNLKNPLEEARTTVVGPFVNRRTKTDTDDWFLPLYATGTRPDGGYTVIPPLLTYRDRDIDSGLNIIGPGFCSWKGGQSCDTRTAQDVTLGLAPFYFFGQDNKRQYEIITPLAHYYRYNSGLQAWTNIWGPYFRKHTEKREMFHLLPLYYSIWGQNERHTTVAPLFHYGYEGEKNLLVTPLFLNANGENDSTTFVTYLYARHRGDTELDMYSPLYWQYRDERIGLSRHFFFPFVYTNHSPRESTTAIIPFFSHKRRHGVSNSWWLTPLFHTYKGLQSWEVDLLPLFLFGRDGHDTHAVAAPLFFDIKSLKNRTTIIPPLLYVRARTPDTLSHVFANIYYRERIYKNGKKWQVHLLPLLSYGQTPNGHFWNLLFGMAGYTREGPLTKVRALWIPITLSRGTEEQQKSGLTPPAPE